MTQPTNPTHDANFHAARAEELTSIALSASMRGCFKRGQRRDLLAAAQVHATLAEANRRTQCPVDERVSLHEVPSLDVVARVVKENVEVGDNPMRDLVHRCGLTPQAATDLVKRAIKADLIEGDPTVRGFGLIKYS